MKKVVAAIAVIAALVLVGSGAWPFPDSGTTYSGTPESITIGNLPLIYSALIYVAEDQGLFAKNGLNREYGELRS
jgi:ABC-type nitrate/sulfonate/bicarbonate transport system substrate-binding protein